MTQEQLDNYKNQLITGYKIPISIFSNLSLNTINNCIPFIKRYLKTKLKNINTNQSCYSLSTLFEKLIGIGQINAGEITIALIHCDFDFKFDTKKFIFNVSKKDINEIKKLIQYV